MKDNLKLEKFALRKSRTESQIVLKQSFLIGFKYVLVRSAPQKVCFGSGLKRECIPLSGPSKTPLMRRLIAEPKPRPGPGDYNIMKSLIKKHASKIGSACLASKVPRTPLNIADKNPSVGSYNLLKFAHPKTSAKPFNVGDKIDTFKSTCYPGPGTYTFQCRKPKLELSFGTSRRILPAVRIICTPKNLANCEICSETPIGDYWHDLKNDRDMCRQCMINETNSATFEIKSRTRKLKRLAELKKYEKVRYCGFYHDHKDTVAAIQLISKRELSKKLRIENYLSLFDL